MNKLHDEMWKLPEDTLSLFSDTDIPLVTRDDNLDEMNYLNDKPEVVDYDKIKYEIPEDNSKILDSNIDYGLYELSENDKVLKDNVKYISLKYICRHLNRTAEWVDDRDILHNLFFILDDNGERLYREPDVVERCKFLKIEFRRTDLPYSKFGRTEAAEYLELTQEQFETMCKDIPHKTETLSNGDTYSIYYKKDLDVFYRRHFFLNILAKSNSSISVDDVIDILDIHGREYEIFKGQYKTQRIKNPDGYVSSRYSSDDIKSYIETHKGDMSIYRPLKDAISSDMARVYIGVQRREWLSILYEKKLLKPMRGANGTKITRSASGFSLYLLDDLDTYMYNKECKAKYGLGNEFITRAHIKNRYGVNDVWIDTYVKYSPDVKIKLTTGDIMTWEYYHKNKLSGIIIGISYADVETLIKNGNFIDITREYVRKKLGIDREIMKRKFMAGKNAIFYMHRKYVEANKKSAYQYNEVNEDDIANAIESKMNEERLILDEKKRLMSKLSKERRSHDNKLRAILGLTQAKHEAITNNKVISKLNSPQIFRCIHKRGKCTVFKSFNPPYNTYDYVSSIERFFTKKSGIDKTSLTMKSLIKGMSLMLSDDFKCTPSWLVYMDSTCYISDAFLKTKLDALPTDVALVGAYGWESIPKSFNWHESNDTYGLYETYSIRDNSTRKHVGTNGFGETKDVAILGGPFFAMRSSMVYDFMRNRHFYNYVVGDDHILPILSLYCRSIKKRVCVIDTTCVSCSDYDSYIGGLEWTDDQIEFTMRWGKELQKLIRNP